jgi:NRPS condensation-like uncharacterized protein
MTQKQKDFIIQYWNSILFILSAFLANKQAKNLDEPKKKNRIKIQGRIKWQKNLPETRWDLCNAATEEAIVLEDFWG